MLLRLWSHFGPRPMHGWREMNRQTHSSWFLCNSVICMISSTWMLWIWHFSTASSCKLLENLICFSLITSSIERCFFASHHLYYHVFCLLILCFFLLVGIWLYKLTIMALQLATLILNAFARQHWAARITLFLSLCPICSMPSNNMLQRIECLPLISVRTTGLQWRLFRSSGRSTILIHWRQLILILTLSSKSLMSKLFPS
jgi:hypothetical protein